MSGFKWIMSEGGPLICMESKLCSSWGGIRTLTVGSNQATNDYDRACEDFDLLRDIPLSTGKALILGELSLDTSFWRSDNGQLFIVQVSCCEEDADFDIIMGGVGDQVFEDPLVRLEFDLASPELILFDSANPGSNTTKESISASLAPGHYRILSQTYDLDQIYSLVLHRFDHIG